LLPSKPNVGFFSGVLVCLCGDCESHDWQVLPETVFAWFPLYPIHLLPEHFSDEALHPSLSSSGSFGLGVTFGGGVFPPVLTGGFGVGFAFGGGVYGFLPVGY
jgi:hypothetical protein